MPKQGQVNALCVCPKTILLVQKNTLAYNTYFENSMQLHINFIVNSVDPDLQKPADQDPPCFLHKVSSIN